MRTAPDAAPARGGPSSLPDPPGPRDAFPLARLFAFRRDPRGALETLQRTHGDVASFRIGRRRIYLLSHPDLVRDVLVTHHRNFIKSYALQRARVLLGHGLLTSENPLHMRQRRLAQPAFHRDRVAALARTMVRYAVDAADRWRPGMEVDAGAEMNRLTLAIAGETLLGAGVEDEADEIRGALTDALGLFNRLHNPLGELLDRIPVPGTIRMRRARERLDATIYRAIAQRRASGEAHDDLLGMLLAARDDEGDGGGMTDEQLRDELLTLFLAGHETTANALAWTWHLLDGHPEVEARLHDELRTVLAGRAPTAEDYPRLPFTRAVLAESMRIRPPAWTIGREPREDFEAGGYRVRAGNIVLVSPWIVHRDPRWWSEPEAFRPERWMAPDFEASLPRMAYFPFGGGPRKCIGEGFAWMEGVLALATLAGRWKLRLLPGARVVGEPRITLRPVGLRMRVERV
ncbi:cytochrome P450 [Longimicrobium sp.]|uniref:cytochrome P450 n=1 Tax=Longimicrobium sp. TaxID=2029185 RepID=UPI002E355787|nr:cytochrome P450 [Longimicrobium sp.]HEX6036468.1 cytochrome P450 [Longimicrobium sp.]